MSAAGPAIINVTGRVSPGTLKLIKILARQTKSPHSEASGRPRSPPYAPGFRGRIVVDPQGSPDSLAQG